METPAKRDVYATTEVGGRIIVERYRVGPDTERRIGPDWATPEQAALMAMALQEAYERGWQDAIADIRGEELMAPAEIAKLCDVTRAAVSNWVKRYDDFPPTVVANLRRRSDVQAWCRRHNKSPKSTDNYRDAA